MNCNSYEYSKYPTHIFLKRCTMKKNILKLTTIFFIFLFIMQPFSICDDIEDDTIDINSEILESSTTPEKDIQIPDTNSRSCIVIDRKTNTILYGKNEKQKRKMASTTKIMTATIIIENCNLDETVEISKKAAGTGAPKSSGGGGEGAGNQRRPGGSGASSDSESPSGLSGAGKSRRKA